MKTGEVLQRIQSLYSKGVDSDESRLSSRHIYNKALTVRDKLVVQALRKNQSFSEWDMQPLHCIEMLPVTAYGCGPNTNCGLMKSKYYIPPAITEGHNENIEVSNIDGSITFSRTMFEKFKYLKGNKFTSRRQHYFIHDGYLYLVNTKLKLAFLHGIWRDPIEVYRLDLYYKGKSTCFDNASVPFYTPLGIIDSIIEIASIELVQQFNQSREDITNNSKDSLLETTK